jgi:hypothetical protein
MPVAALACHPVAQCLVVNGVVAHAERQSAAALSVRYVLSGTIAALQLPKALSSQRRDELWRHTCAELFVGVPGERRYCEFNFSPSSEWAAYQFDDYRQGMRAVECAPPSIEVTQSISELCIKVSCGLPAWLAQSQQLQLGICMVIEDTQGQCSYWALRHPAERPDFHHRDGFGLHL